MTSLGELLQRARNTKGWSCEYVAQQLGVQVPVLFLLEAGQFERLQMSDSFIVQYLSAYANLLGLDANVVVNLYCPSSNNRDKAEQKSWRRSKKAANKPARSSKVVKTSLKQASRFDLQPQVGLAPKPKLKQTPTASLNTASLRVPTDSIKLKSDFVISSSQRLQQKTGSEQNRIAQFVRFSGWSLLLLMIISAVGWYWHHHQQTTASRQQATEQVQTPFLQASTAQKQAAAEAEHQQQLKANQAMAAQYKILKVPPAEVSSSEAG